jgi:hypothetical protein
MELGNQATLLTIRLAALQAIEIAENPKNFILDISHPYLMRIFLTLSWRLAI